AFLVGAGAHRLLEVVVDHDALDDGAALERLAFAVGVHDAADAALRHEAVNRLHQVLQLHVVALQIDDRLVADLGHAGPAVDRAPLRVALHDGDLEREAGAGVLLDPPRHRANASPDAPVVVAHALHDLVEAARALVRLD